jgi:hypothetical protein
VPSNQDKYLTSDCGSGAPVVFSGCDRLCRQDRRSMLLRNDVLRMHVIWREEMAGVE